MCMYFVCDFNEKGLKDLNISCVVALFYLVSVEGK